MSIGVGGHRIEAQAAAESLSINFNPPDTSAARAAQIMPFAPIAHGAVIATLLRHDRTLGRHRID